MSAQWHYTRNGESAGQVTSEELRTLATTGQIGQDDLVWKTGMAEWSPAGKIKGLFPAAPVAAVPVAARSAPAMATAPVAVQPIATEPSQIGYFSTTTGLPPRTAKTLKGYAPATGDRGDWPLTDQHFVQLMEAHKARKPIRSAASLYRSMFVLLVVVAAIVAIAIIIGALSSNRGLNSSAILSAASSVAAFGAFAVLYFFTWKATLKCHRWAPLTMLIIFALNAGSIAFFSAMMMNRSFRFEPAMLVGPGIILLLTIAFMAMSWKAYRAIPRFLASPLWAQEVLATIEVNTVRYSFLAMNR